MDGYEQKLPPLTPATQRFLNILKQYEGKQINLRQYALMLGVSRRRIRIMMSELRKKGYVKMIPENGKIHKSQACRYIFLDEKPTTRMLSEDILKRLGMIEE